MRVLDDHSSCGTQAVVDREDPGELLGLLAVENVLHGRLRDLAEERHRERGFLLGSERDREIPGR